MIGETVGNLRIVSELGIGLMGVVYLAEHIKLGKRFVIKSLSPKLSDPQFRERFYREARNQALLSHPHIVQFIDFYEKDGQFFLVTEYVDGENLSKLIKARGQLKEKDVLSILGDVLKGLDFAHTKGIIHRNIKPSSIIIDKLGIARITNFGIDNLVGEGGLNSTRATVRSPWYLSPEQIQHPRQLDQRTDIYSLGIVLYEMLVGEIPFSDESDFSIMEKQLHMPPPTLHLKNPGISEELAAIVLKATAKNPAERFQGCAEFLERIRERERQRSEEEALKKTEERTRKLAYVFVCYAREDTAFTLQLGENLKRRGVPVWLDQWNIPPGSDWDQSIDNAICDCAKFIIVLSSQSVGSTEVRGELRTALDEHKPIIPVIHSPCRVPRQLRTIQYIDFISRGPDDEAAVGQLLRTLATSTTDSRVVQHVETPDRQQFAPESAPKQPEGALEPGTVFRDKLKDGSEGPEMVVVPAGTFEMGDIQGTGDDREKPVHTVRIAKPFAIGRCPINFDEYDRFASVGCRLLPDDCGWGRGRQPAINVSWDDAVEYAKWLSGQTGKRYRLPTEAEWEYAARAATETDYWWGNEMKSGMANCREGDTRWGGKKTSPIGSFPKNPFGLYDMAGNVWEWVQDDWHENYEGAPTDGSAWLRANGGRRVIRGGSWFNLPEFLRASDRDRNGADDGNGITGFRLARDLN